MLENNCSNCSHRNDIGFCDILEDLVEETNFCVDYIEKGSDNNDMGDK